MKDVNMNFCPNYRNKAVKDSFNEIITAFGGKPLTDDEFKSSELRNKRSGLDYSAMEAAYKMWGLNNGNPIDLDRNGNISILFKLLVTYTKGDRATAILMKSRIYSKAWQNETKITDKEPTLDQLVTPKNKITKTPTNIDMYLTREFSPVTTDSFFGKKANDDLMNNGKASSRDILNNMLEQMSIPLELTGLAEVLSDHDVDVIIDTNIDDGFGHKAIAEYRGYRSGRVVIAIDPMFIRKFNNEYASRIFIHELVHALTSHELDDENSKLSKSTRSIFRLVKKEFPDKFYGRIVGNGEVEYADDYYGLTNEKEFVSEFISNTVFRSAVIDKLSKSQQKNKFGILGRFVKSIINFFTGKSSEENIKDYQQLLIKYLVNHPIIKNSRINPSNLLKQVGNKIDYNTVETEQLQEAKSDLSTRLHYFSSGFNIPTGEEHEGKPLTEPEIVEKIKTSTHEIVDALKKQLAGIMSSKIDPAERSRLSLQVLSQIDSFANQRASTILSILTFLTQASGEIVEDAKRITKLTLENRMTSDTKYMDDMHTNFGAYRKVYNQITSLLKNDAIVAYLTKLHGENKLFSDSVIGNIEQMRLLAENTEHIVLDTITMLDALNMRNVKRDLAKVGMETNSLTMADYILHLEDNGVKDLNSVVTMFGDLGKSADEGVRALVYMVNKAINDADSLTHDKSVELLRLQENLKSGESIKDLYEMTDDGASGYLVRKYNYGLFYKDYNNFLIELNLKYGLDPTNKIAPTDDETRKKWNHEKNVWLSEHCNRRFKPQYYEAFENMSAETREQYDIILNQIRQLKETCLGDDGFYHYEKLTDKLWNQLSDLYTLKRWLKNDYYPNGELKQEGTVDYKIAKELQDMENKLYGKDKRKIKMAQDKWAEARDKIIKQCGGKSEYQKGRDNDNFDWDTLDKWDSRNTKRILKMNEDGSRALVFDVIDQLVQDRPIYDVIDDNGISDNGARYNELKEIRNKLLAPARNLYTGEVDNTKISKPVRTRLRRINLEMNRIARKAKIRDKHTKELSKAYQKVFKKYLKSEFTDQYKNYLKIARKKDIDNPGYLDAFLAQTGYYIQRSDDANDVEWRPFLWFTKLVALPEYQDLFMDVVPGDGWMDKDDGGDLLNKDFDESQGMAMVPKGQKYDNSALYNKIMNSPTLKALYDGVFNTIKEANQMLTVRNYHDDYLLPLITGSAFRLIRGTKWKKAWDYIKYGKGTSIKGAGNALKRTVTANEEDELFGQALKDMFIDVDEFGNQIEMDDDSFSKSTGAYADGRLLNMVPIYFTKKLAHPELITADLIGSVCEYYHRSALFKNRHDIKDTCESIVDALGKRKYAKSTTSKISDFINSAKNKILGKETKKSPLANGLLSNTYKAARKFLDMNLYDIRSTDKMGPTFTKLGLIFRACAVAINLGMNPVVAIVGYLTLAWTDMINAVIGLKYGKGAFLTHPVKYFRSWFTNSDIDQSAGRETMWSLIKQLSYYLPGRTLSYVKNDTHLAIMEYFNVSDQLLRSYENSNRNKILEGVRRHAVFGGMSFFDYIAKGHIAEEVLMNYKLVDGHFVTKTDIAMMGLGKSLQEAKSLMDKYDRAKTLRSFMYTENGKLRIKPGVKSEFDRIKNTVQNKINHYAASADGVPTSTQKAAITTGFVGSCILMHRQYLPLMLQERFGETYYDLDTQEYNGGMFRVIGSLIFAPLVDAFNMTQGNGFLRPFKSSFYKQIGREYKKEWQMMRDPAQKDAKGVPMYIYQQYVKQVLLEVGMYLLLSIGVGAICSRADDDDEKENLLLQFAAFTARRMQWEVFTPYRFDDMFNNFKTVSAASSASDKFQSAISSTMQYVSPMAGGLFDTFFSSDLTSKQYEPIVQRGVYKDWYKYERDWFKFIFPGHNAYELIYGSKDKRKYYENQIMKLNK